MEVKKENQKDPRVVERIKTCRKCEFLIPKVHICKKCGCFMPWKVKIKQVTCPIDKWGPIID